MTIYFGCHTVLVMLLAALVFASMISHSNSRPLATEVADQYPQMQSVLELLSRDDIVQMAGYGEEKLSTVLITGTVLCNKACVTASQYQLSPGAPQPISGALVGTTCHTNMMDERASGAKAVTDQYGEFIIDLPSHLHGIPNLDEVCSVRILQLPTNSPCHLSGFPMQQHEVKLSSVGNGIRTYNTGTMIYLNTLPKNSATCMKELENEKEKSW